MQPPPRLDLGDAGQVSTCWNLPADARWLYVLAHGAGAGMRHEFLEELSARLAKRQIATLRYQFPYMEAGARLPSRPPLLHATVRAALTAATRVGLPIIAGGKSMGGRMTSQLLAIEPMAEVRGMAFLGFPLHPARKPSVARADHLAAVGVPMLMLQGTRDALAELPLIRGVCAQLSRATLHVIDDGDHSFAVRKRSGRTLSQARDEIADALAAWAATL